MRAAMFYEPGDVRMEDVEAVGLPEPWERSLRVVRKGGDVTHFGGAPSGTTTEVDAVLLRCPRITTRGILHHISYDVRAAFDLPTSGRIDPEPFVSEVRPPDGLVEAFESHGRQEGIEYEIRPQRGRSS